MFFFQNYGIPQHYAIFYAMGECIGSWPFAVCFQSSVERNPYVIQDCFGL